MAAFLQVQTSAQNTGTGATVVITTAATTSNNLVVVHIKIGSAGGETCSSVTDDKLNTYVLSTALTTATFRMYQAYGVQVTGGTTAITCAFSGSAAKRCGADEYSGNARSNAATFDASTTGTGTGTSAAVSALTSATAGELIIATCISNGAVTWTAGTNYTLYNGSGVVTVRSEYRLLGTTSETAPATLSGSTEWGEIATAFKAPIGFNAVSNSGEQLAQSSYAWNHTCAGADRYLVVGIGMLSLAQTVSTITYATIALTLLGVRSSVTGAARIELWGIIAPATGLNSIAVTLTGAINSGGVAASYTGVHQTSPTEAFNSNQATNVGAADATVDVTTVAVNDWVVDVVASDDTAITVGTGQTQRNNIAGTVGAVANSDEGPKTPAGAVTMSWTAVGALATWSIGGIALRPVTASSLAAALTPRLPLLGVG